MSLQNVQKIADQKNHQKSWFQRFSSKTGLVVAGTAVGSAHAEGVGDIYTQATTDLAGVSGGTLSLILIFAGIVALIIGWQYFKKVR